MLDSLAQDLRDATWLTLLAYSTEWLQESKCERQCENRRGDQEHVHQCVTSGQSKRLGISIGRH